MYLGQTYVVIYSTIYIQGKHYKKNFKVGIK